MNKTSAASDPECSLVADHLNGPSLLLMRWPNLEVVVFAFYSCGVIKSASSIVAREMGFLRFAKHAPYWQYLIWVRSLGLVVVGFLPILVTPDAVDDELIGPSSPLNVKISVWVQLLRGNCSGVGRAVATRVPAFQFAHSLMHLDVRLDLDVLRDLAGV